MDETARHALQIRLGDFAHEMRTPLNCVLGFSQVLMASEPDEGRRAHAARIVEGAKELDRLITDLVHLADQAPRSG